MPLDVNSWNQNAFGASASGRGGLLNAHNQRMFGSSEHGKGGMVNAPQGGQPGFSTGMPFAMPPGSFFSQVTPAPMPGMPSQQQVQPEPDPQQELMSYLRQLGII